MFFFSRQLREADWIAPERGAQSLGLFAGHPADSHGEITQFGKDFYAELPGPRAPARRGWRVRRTPEGAAVLLLGWIDNLDELSARLGSSGSAEQVYGAAVARWGAEADRHVIGEYASLTVLPDGRIRMARSPWASFPLFYQLGASGFAACSILRPLFAAGLDKRLRSEAIDRLIAFELSSSDQSRFAGIDIVPGGTVVTVAGQQIAQYSYYDPADIPQVRFRHDADYVAAANEMLGTAVRHALAPATRPAVTLSGGLDSPILADEVLRQLPGDARLTTITFEPLDEWSGQGVPLYFSDERRYIDQFLAMHPRIDPIFTQNRDVDFLSDSEQLFLASDAGHPARVIGMVHTGVMHAARHAGVDWLLTGGLGNFTISEDAPWAPAEFFRRLRWGELVRHAATRLDDPRPLWRRIAASGIMPNLPPGLRRSIRGLKRRADSDAGTNPYIARGGRLAQKRLITQAQDNMAATEINRTRRELVRAAYSGMSRGNEIGLGSNQLYGFQSRDVFAYRPLIELCLGMPTDQFVRRGERRWLARRMAVGRLPEAQRTELRHADHLVDWHERMTPMLPQLRAEIAQIAQNPEMAGLVDTAAMLRDLDQWPATAPTDIETVTRLRFALPAMIYVRRFIDFETGRNPQ